MKQILCHTAARLLSHYALDTAARKRVRARRQVLCPSLVNSIKRHRPRTVRLDFAIGYAIGVHKRIAHEYLIDMKITFEALLVAHAILQTERRHIPREQFLHRLTALSI